MHNFETISDKNYGKNCYLDNFVFLSSLTPLNNVEGNEQNFCQAMLLVRNII